MRVREDTKLVLAALIIIFLFGIKVDMLILISILLYVIGIVEPLLGIFV